MRPKQVRATFLAQCLGLAGLLGISACGKALPIHYYDMRYPAAPPLAGSAKYPGTLAIAGFSASSQYRQNRLIYRESATPARVGFYDDRRWIGPPTELMTQAALVHFRNSRLFANVIPYSDRSNADFVLQGRITELDEVDMSDGYHGRISIYAELIETGKGSVLWSGPVSVARKTTVRDVDAIVGEIAQGVGELLQALALTVDRAIGGSRPNL